MRGVTMRVLRRGVAAPVLAVLLFVAPAQAQQPVPARAARVTDLANALPASARSALDAKLAAFEARKGSQIAVLLVATTAPEAIEQYSLRVAEAWKLGRAGVDDGVLLVVAVQDRRARFEVGYGLEGPVPDALARRIIAEQLAPKFRDGDFAGGIDAGVDALIRLIDGEALPGPSAQAPGGIDSWHAFPVLIFIVAILAPVFRRVFGTLFGSLALGAGAGFVVWLISSILFASVLAGGLVFVFALTGIGVGGGGGRWASRGPFGGMPGGFGGGFGGGGFGRGGGGFSGGGGRFGGGGASGGW